MIIHGLQKMTLLDFPGQVACTVFLGGCEFRCPFCHNADLLDMSAPGIMNDDELLEFLKKRKGLLDGVAFTGGEPLLRKDLPELLARVRDIGYQIKNSPARYAETIGWETFDIAPVDESIQFLLSGQVRYEFRTTVVKQFHDEASFEAIAQWIDGADRYELQGFVDRDTVPFAGLEACSREEMECFADIVRPHVKTVELRGV